MCVCEEERCLGYGDARFFDAEVIEKLTILKLAIEEE
jgi:hypothetical protein